MEFVSHHHFVLLLLSVSTVSARADCSNTRDHHRRLWTGDADLPQENSCGQNSYYSLAFQMPKPQGHPALTSTELAGGTPLLFSLCACSHAVPLRHLPSGSGCFLSHRLDRARDACPLTEAHPREAPGTAGSGTGTASPRGPRAKQEQEPTRAE